MSEQDPTEVPGDPPSPGAPAAEGAHPAGAVPEVDGTAADEADALVAEAEEALQGDLSGIARERDEYRSLAQRIQADFENYKKRVAKQQTEHLERAAEELVVKLLPVLDTADLAVGHDESESLLQLASSLYDVLGKQGLERLDPAGNPFDPNEHDAVLHEEGEGESVVSEVLRAGYRWKGRVLRPAMVKVRG